MRQAKIVVFFVFLNYKKNNTIYKNYKIKIKKILKLLTLIIPDIVLYLFLYLYKKMIWYHYLVVILFAFCCPEKNKSLSLSLF